MHLKRAYNMQKTVKNEMGIQRIRKRVREKMQLKQRVRKLSKKRYGYSESKKKSERKMQIKQALPHVSTWDIIK